MAKRTQVAVPADHQVLYRGASGQMAVLSEFLYRQLNVAVPEVDVGDDIFVVKAIDDTVTRVQTKHATALGQQDGTYVAQFNLPWAQLIDFDKPNLVYALAVRHQDRWTDFLVIRRSVLAALQKIHNIGSANLNKRNEPVGLKLRLVFTADDVKAKGGFSLQPYRGAFSPWPPPLP